MHLTLRSALALLVIALVGLAWSVGGAPEAKITSISLRSVEGLQISSECPKEVAFRGSITVSEACQVDYRFVRSDSGASRWERLTFTAAGSQNISYSWTLPAGYSGWVAAEAFVVRPRLLRGTAPPGETVRSTNAFFSLVCQPRITDVRPVFNESGDLVAVEIQGLNLGSSGLQALYIDRAPASRDKINSWTDNRIEVNAQVFGASGPQWWDHNYMWYIGMSVAGLSMRLSNVFAKRFPVHLHLATPPSGPAGTAIEIRGDGLTHPGDLKIGPQFMPTVSPREMHRIRATVPSGIGPGTHQLSIVQGGTTISDTIPFTVR